MKIYTKSGDQGFTTSYNGSKLPKDHPLIVLGGKLDSLLASLDSAKMVVDKETRSVLDSVCEKLWQTGGEISLGKLGKNVKNPVKDEDVVFFEEKIDELNPKISYFVRFDKEASVRLNEARVRCRELEIHLTPFFRDGKIRPEVYKYINRLSDFLYLLACIEQNKN